MTNGYRGEIPVGKDRQGPVENPDAVPRQVPEPVPPKPPPPPQPPLPEEDNQ